eukprot:scaffold570_cov45-Phaeocystis_antarctica.AAC.1
MATLTSQARAAVTTTLSAAMGGLTGTSLVSSAPVAPHFLTSTNRPPGYRRRQLTSLRHLPEGLGLEAGLEAGLELVVRAGLAQAARLKVLTHLLTYFLTYFPRPDGQAPAPLLPGRHRTLRHRPHVQL